jgi:hypothetical protein
MADDPVAIGADCKRRTRETVRDGSRLEGIEGEVFMTPSQTPHQIVTLDQALDVAEALPDEQLEVLLEILQKRRLKRQRADFVARAKATSQAYKRGDLETISVTAFLKEVRAED